MKIKLRLKKSKKWALIILIFGVLLMRVNAYSGSENYNLSLIALDSGENNISSTNYEMNVAFNLISSQNISSETYNIQLGIFLEKTSVQEEIVLSTTISRNGGGSSYFKTLFYDLLVNIYDKVVFQGDEINSTITIINTGDVPDRDTILITYLKSPSNINYSMQKDNFLQILPGEKNINISKQIPFDAEIGEWQYIAYYNSFQQEPIESINSFIVVSYKSQQLFYLIIGIFIIFIVYLLILYGYEYKEENKEEY